MFNEKLKRQMDYIGLICKTTHPFKNAYATVPEGAYVLVVASSRGLSVETRQCCSCGVKVHMSGVRPEGLEPIYRGHRAEVRWDRVYDRASVWEGFDEWLQEKEAHPEGRPLVDIL
jgi:hypothetical protein